ncbi:MAG TPA: bifunctional phosphoribosylaminoimidazolecarboxamide formyltransferase/IMP cyclohydrolase [bacterium]|nr:bifunctional phosphoribosylaminoimidazolecarboxamide formyltransferase/IMP cyclohydrolase [bacterium]HEX68269.1 bifunctional phosphoribosylaminoimidazolecarboxamide formyltransferase/IMP cyclohydrolase [bacterium]
MKVKRALLSVYDKRGIVEFAKGLSSLGIEIISTGGTARLLKEKNIPVKEVSEVTGFPEILEGRVKTLHPMVHGGILYKRDRENHRKEVKKLGIPTIDLIAVNLYPFREAVSRADVKLEDALENIDIGGPTMVRAAAKNFPYVIVIVNPEDYTFVLEKLKKEGDLSFEERRNLAEKAFLHTASYDLAISNYFVSLRGEEIPSYLLLEKPLLTTLRYGENPHQKSAFYSSTLPWEKLQGKEISYNNLLDIDAVVRILRDFPEPTAVVIKHTNPCGLACAEDIYTAYIKARDADPVSAFGSVVGVNREVNEKLAKELTSTFVEVIVAPSYSNSAFKNLSTRPNMRVLIWKGEEERWELRSVEGGILLQEKDLKIEEPSNWRIVSRKEPTQEELEDLFFAWRVVKHVKSNAIVVAKDKCTLGIGAGQMSRIDAVKIALSKSRSSTQGAVLASDAFFPFPDSIEEAAKAGITAIVEPGGAKRDEECIRTADEYGIALIFTGKRHFRH